MAAWVYILECGDGSLYVGSTNDLEKRVAEHQAGLGGRYTQFKQPVKLVFNYETARMDEAYALEQQLKGWRRAKRLALIRGDYGALVELSKTTGRRAESASPELDRRQALRQAQGTARAGRSTFRGAAFTCEYPLLRGVRDGGGDKAADESK